jgi:L,D-transpeptidase ErfK/SrfK
MICSLFKCKLSINIVLYTVVISSNASVFEFHPYSSDIIGKVERIIGKPGDTLASIGVEYDIGHVEMIEANPEIDPEYPLDSPREIIIPNEYILPPGVRTGIVINVAELRLYYYHNDAPLVTSLPIGIGRKDWGTPIGETKIIEKIKFPKWHPTENIRNDAKEKGIFLPKVVDVGPDNPLGKYAMRLAWTEYLIHGTNRIEGVGRRSSAGCIRMFPEDIEHLFSLVKINTPVRIINEPVKIGWADGAVFIEAHAPLREDLHKSLDWSSIVEHLYNKYGEKNIN